MSFLEVLPLCTEDTCLSWELKIVHAHRFSSETCLEWLFKAQAKLICGVDQVLRKFQDTCEESPKQGVCEGAWSLLQLSHYVHQCHSPMISPTQAGFKLGSESWWLQWALIQVKACTHKKFMVADISQFAIP